MLGRGPAERADGAAQALDDLLARDVIGPVESRSLHGAALVTVGGRGVVALTDADVDELSGETVDQITRQTVARLQVTLAEAAEARAPRVFLQSAALAALAILVGVGLVWAVGRAHRAAADQLVALAERSVASSRIADLEALRASRLLDFERWVVTASAVVVDVVIAYATVTFVLRQLPVHAAVGRIDARVPDWDRRESRARHHAEPFPGCSRSIVILFIARFVIRLLRLWFSAIESGRMPPRLDLSRDGAADATARRRGSSGRLPMVLAYPICPEARPKHSKASAFCSASWSRLARAGIVNQIMSGFMLTYSRALRLGDFVRIGDSKERLRISASSRPRFAPCETRRSRFRMPWSCRQTTTDYSRFSASDGVFTSTSVTIGYDAPWRQVHALLLAAAERTPGLRRQPEPVVLQTALEDFYVKYTLFVCLEHPESRLITLNGLHAHIQDLFNEYGVQIMSPHYQRDPAAPKVVARKDWFAPPAHGESQRTAS